MLTRMIILLFCVSVFAIPNVTDRTEVTYPSSETLRSGIKVMKFRAFGRDIELRLQPAGDIVSDDYVVTDSNGNIRVTDVKSLKSKLYKDEEKGAVLYIDDDESLEINGIINSKLRIEPYKSEKMVKNGINAHLITESLAKKKPVNDAEFTINMQKSLVEVVRNFDESQCVHIKYLCVMDNTFTSQFESYYEIQSFLASMFVKVQNIMDTLNLKIKVTIIGSKMLIHDTQYIRQSLIPGLETYNVAHIIQNFTKFYCHQEKDNLVKEANIIMFFTKRALGEPQPDGTIFDAIVGVANLGGACNPCEKCGVIHAEKKNMLGAADTVAHETAHLIGSPHDGEGPERSVDGSPAALNCSGKLGYIMGNDYGKNEKKFSSCSRANIVYFLGLSRANCIIKSCSNQ
nr:putative metalloprotease Tcis_Metallo_3 [Tityus cisandinus]